jgi:hypothetical protein
MLGIFPLRKRELRTLVGQTNLGKEANLSRNSEREGSYSTRLLEVLLMLPPLRICIEKESRQAVYILKYTGKIIVQKLVN